MNGEALSLTCATMSFFVGWCIALVMDWALHKFMEIKNDEPLPEDSEGDQLCTVSIIRALRTFTNGLFQNLGIRVKLSVRRHRRCW